MSVGLCCQYMVPRKKRDGTIEWNNATQEKNLQFGAFNKGKYSDTDILKLYKHNLTNLLSILQRVVKEGIRSFRCSSNILPLIDSVSPKFLENEELLLCLRNVGAFVIESGIRFTVHPDQFCVISSMNEDVIKNSFKILKYHAWIFDSMGLPRTPYNAINIHGGAKGQSTTLIKSILSLEDSVRQRLTLENDERSYNTKELYEVFKETNVPICWDSHHHTFNNSGLSSEEALSLSISTWGKEIKPLTHLSNTAPALINGSFTDRRKHSDYVHYIPEHQLLANNNGLIDIDFEFKMKNEAIFKAVKDFGIKL